MLSCCRQEQPRVSPLTTWEHHTEVLANAERQGNKRHLDWERQIQLSLFTVTRLCNESQRSTQTTEINMWLQNGVRYKINIQK